MQVQIDIISKLHTSLQMQNSPTNKNSTDKSQDKKLDKQIYEVLKIIGIDHINSSRVDLLRQIELKLDLLIEVREFIYNKKDYIMELKKKETDLDISRKKLKHEKAKEQEKRENDIRYHRNLEKIRKHLNVKVFRGKPQF